MKARMDAQTFNTNDVAAAEWLARAAIADRQKFDAAIEHLGRNDLRDLVYAVARRGFGAIR